MGIRKNAKVGSATETLPQASSRFRVFLASLLLFAGYAGTPGGTAGVAPSATAGSDAIVDGVPLTQEERVTANGAYQTGFSFPVPPAPGEPVVSLSYSSQANGTLAGAGWDLFTGFPMSIMRDLRFGTPRWTFDADWQWGSTPLVRLDPGTCGARCSYRTAPEASIDVTIDLTPPPSSMGSVPPARQERATVRLPSGTVLDYEPIYYDSATRPAAPAGAATDVLGFRLVSAVDRNGHATCFKYQGVVDPADVAAQRTRGRIAPLEEIAYGPGNPASRAQTCALIFANPAWPSIWHRVHFDYDSLSRLSYASTWSLRYGAPVAFDSLLKRVAIYPRGAAQPQDEFYTQYLAARETETRRPLLTGIAQTVPDLTPAKPGDTVTRIVRTFRYGMRNLQFGPAELIELGEQDRFPASLSGEVTRPIRHASIFGDDNIFDAGQDQDSDAAPPTHATTEQWAFMDVNGDGLVDVQWANERGADPLRTWSTFEPAPPLVGTSGVNINQRTPMQQILVNHGIAGSRLGSSRTWLASRAPLLEGAPMNPPAPRAPGYYSDPTPRTSIPLGSNAFTSWIWGEGRGQTRTGMPVSISAPEIAKPSGHCPRNAGQDPRRWPMYPDKTFAIPRTSFGVAASQNNVLDPGSPTYAGFPGISNILEGIYQGYNPSYSVSATVSGWGDLDADGIPEFAATPAWIERFGLDPLCAPFNDPQAWPAQILQERTLDFYFAHEPQPATDASGAVDTQWHLTTMPALVEGATINLDLDSAQSSFPPSRKFGPPGPVGLPFSYDVSTGSSEGFGVTLPISGLVSASISSIMSQSWIPIAAAAPGLTVETFSPRGSTGYRMSIATPSETGTAQAAASMASNGVKPTSIAELAMSVVRINFDFTLVSTKERNRAESRAQMLDLNADGLIDYLLYNSGTNLVGTDASGAPTPLPRGSLVAYLNSPTGRFRGPVVINQGFDYPSSVANPANPVAPVIVPDLDAIDEQVCQATTLTSQLTSLVSPGELADFRCTDGGAFVATLTAGFGTIPPDQFCKSAPVPLSPTCVPYTILITNLADRADRILARVQPYMSLTRDAIPRERDLVSHVATLKDFLRGFGQTIVLHPDLVSVDVTTAAARALTADLALVARTLRHINYSSRVNTISTGFSETDGSLVNQKAAGMTAQTKGFIDLNGDGLPDYVVANDRETPCPPDTWQVFWGSGTSSLAQNRAFLRELNATGQLAPTCLPVPAAPADVVARGFTTLPLNVDFVSRAPTAGNQIDTQVDSFVSLNDVNRDSRPDIVIAGQTWNESATVQTWRVFFNTGSGFETTATNITSPTSARTDIAPASTVANPAWLGRSPLNVPYPALRTSHAVSTVIGSMSRATGETHATLLDIDGDGVPEMVRRVRILATNTEPAREGMLMWRRTNVGGPQDLLIEERDPIAGHRTLIEYRTAASFQWPDAKLDGAAPQAGHRNLMGVAGQLVRSVTEERVIGRVAQRTRMGYDYKLPHFDMATRSPNGFARRLRFALDPTPDDPAAAQPVAHGLAVLERSAQRPHGLPGLTHVRSVERGTGAPVQETLNSFHEAGPVAACPGVGSFAADPSGRCVAIGGLQTIYSAPNRVLRVEYPSSVATAPVLDLSFDGRAPWRDAVTSSGPQMPAAPCPAFDAFLSSAPAASAATGGAVQLTSTLLPANCAAPSVVRYASPFVSNTTTPPTPLRGATLELWINPDPPVAEQVIAEQPGAMQLRIVNTGGGWHWRLDYGLAASITSGGPDDLLAGRWQHVVATYGSTGARIFLNGRMVVESAVSDQSVPNGAFFVGCGSGANGAAPNCFNGALGELRAYAEYWPLGPRVVGSMTELSAPPGCGYDGGAPVCPHDFGQPRLVRHDNDLADAADDVVTEFEYAAPDPNPNNPRAGPVRGLLTTEATWVPNPDGTPREFLSFTARHYDGRPHGRAAAGNETQRSQFDGMAQAQKPAVAALRVKSTMAYGVNCPGLASSVTDPLGGVTRTTWDDSCAFALAVTNPVGHVARSQYYGVVDAFAPVTGKRTGPYGTWPLSGRYGQVARAADANGAASLTTYDEWGRAVASWSPLDRDDRPGTLIEYGDACAPGSVNAARCPASRTTTRTWDEQLRRCVSASGKVVACSEAGAVGFAVEQSTGAYYASHVFNDGQVHAQSVNGGTPAFTVSGIADFDVLGRMSRAYKVQFLPSACPAAGKWCDSASLPGDPLRSSVAAVQLAYDTRGRTIRTYGPAWPRCAGDPSAVTSTVPGVREPDCDTRSAGVNDVTKISYPAPGDTLTLDANGVPMLTHTDTRGLVTLTRDYLLAGRNAPPGTPPVPYATVTARFDALGRLLSTTDQAGHVSLNTYDALSRLRSATDPDLGHTTFEYDLRSALTDSLAATGEKTEHEYDIAGRLVQTDYLRPKQVPAGSSGPTLNIPGDDPPVRVTPPFCYDVPELGNPTRFEPMGGWPDPPRELRPLALTRAGLVPQAQLTLPFDVNIVVSATPTGDPNVGRAPRPRAFRFSRGTPIRIAANGQVSLGNEKIGATFDVLGAQTLQVSEGGLRYGLAGLNGHRTLTLEWRGVLREQPESPVLVRMSVAEDSSVVRYEYERVPRVGGGSLRLRDGATQYATRVLPAGDGGSFIPQGSVYAFGELPDARHFRVRCDRFPKGGFEIPIAAGDGFGQRLRLRFRVSGACSAEQDDCRGELRVGYRAAGERNAAVQPLTVVPYTTRAPDARNAAGDFPNEIDVALPDDLHNQKFDMVIEPVAGARDLATAVIPHDFSFTWPGRTQTIYEPEERVHRAYDSSEPAFYIATRANGARFEEKPLLDLTFDVPGKVTDRAPGGASFDAASCAPGANAGNFVDGASGSALSISPYTHCTGALAGARPLQQFTVELWAAPHCENNCAARSLVNAGTMFSISLLADGRARCTVGTGSVDTVDPLPADVWTHLALTFDATRTLRCSVNGVSQGVGATGSIAPTATLSSVRLGEPLATGTAVDVDEVRIIGSARTSAEVAADALRPLNVGPPRGNLVHLDFGHAAAAGAACPNNSACTWQSDQSQARNDAVLVDGKIVAGIQGMVFDTRAARPPGAMTNLPAPGGLVRVAHSPTLQLADAVTTELWLKTTGTQTGAARLVGKWAGPTNPGWRLQMTPSGRLRWEIVARATPAAGGGAQIRRSVFITQEVVNDYRWHHVAATYDGQRMRVFRDGLPLHRWCGSGPREGAEEDGPGIESCLAPPPILSECTPIETVVTELPTLPGQKQRPVLGDTECIHGSIDNAEPLLAANDPDGAALDGYIDELRLSNFAKREFEVAASARLASAYTRTLGRETGMRNRFIVLDGRQVGPAANDQPYDLAWQPAREQRAYDLAGTLISNVKHVVGQRGTDDVLARVTPDSAGRAGLAQFPHGEVIVASFDVDGTQHRLIGYGPRIGQLPGQSQAYVADATATLTGRPAQVKYGNGVSTSWAYDDAAAPTAATGSSSGAFGPDSLRMASVTNGAGAPLSNRVYDWDAVGNLTQVSDDAGGAGGIGQYDSTYGYDDLRRVTSATLALPQRAPLDFAYGYDPLGNLTLIDGSNAQGDLRLLDGGRQAYGRTVSQTCTGAPSPLPHALTTRTVLTALPATLTTNALCYDAAGRLIHSVDSVRNSINTYKYFARGKVRSVVYRAGESHYLYDGNGVRVSRVDPVGPTHIVLSPSYREIFDPSTPAAPPALEALYSASGRPVARRLLSSTGPGAPLATAATALNWFSTDQLGGTAFMTNAQGQEVSNSRAFYRPFGGFVDRVQPPQGDAAGNRLFTGKELESTGLYDFGARLYDPLSGRFTQADTIATGNKSQELNRYSYVLNNPLRLIDPDGHQAANPDAWKDNPIRPSESSEADAQLAATRAGVGATAPLHERAKLDAQSDAYFTSPESYFAEAADAPPAAFKYIPGARAGWLLGEVIAGQTMGGAPTRHTLGEVGSLVLDDWVKIELMFAGAGMAGTFAGRTVSFLRAQAAQEVWWTEQMLLRSRLESAAQKLPKSTQTRAGSALNAHAQNSGRAGGSSFPPFKGNPTQTSATAQETLGKILTAKGRYEIHLPNGTTAIYDPATGRGALFNANGEFSSFRDMLDPRFRVRTDLSMP